MLLSVLALGLAAELPADAVTTWDALNRPGTLQADFTQIRTSSLLKEPLETKGRLVFSRPQKMAWTTTAPLSSTFVVDGTKVGMSYPDLGVREEIDLGTNAEVASLVTSMMVWLGGDLDQVQQDYTLTWTPGPPTTALLEPKDERLRSIISTLELHIDTTPQISEVVITEPDGDTVRIAFENVKLDAALPEGAFVLP
ncbi:MAG TPA: outer membrane lipoprotein carrier protein LolA [Myxococcota bacterium]|nr:outer membrane lipoprotein carrier protein LolA [Myxococcota bacterium]